MEQSTQPLPTSLDGPWAIAPEYIQAAIQAAGKQLDRRAANVFSQGRVSVIEIAGTMSRSGGYWGGTSTEAVREAIAEATANPNVDGIVLKISSGGGQVWGTQELGAAIQAAKLSKPVYAAIQDVGASAAYWVASQASKVFATSDSMVGSIGTVAVIWDHSKAADEMGVKVHVVLADNTSEVKGTGVPGAPVTEGQLAAIKDQLNSYNQMFMDAVQAGRGMNKTQVKSVANGRMWLASDAKEIGLIDEVATIQSVIDELTATTSAGNLGSQTQMANTTQSDGATAQQTPSISESVNAYRDACPGASDSQVLAWITSGKSVTSAMTEFITDLRLQVASLHDALAKKEEEIAEASKNAQTVEAKSGAVQPVVIGLQPIESTPEVSATGTAAERWQAKLNALLASGMKRQDAVAKLTREEPALWAEYIGRADLPVR